MHDDRALIEERLSRALRQRIRPALYVRTAPLQVRAWHVDGEPVPASDALAAHADGKYESFEIGQPWGSPWSTTWFELTGQVPADWAGERVEVVMDLGFDGEGPGFQAEGMAYDADGVPIKGIAPLNAYVPVAEGVENVHLFIEAAANPSILHDFLPTEMGDRLTAPDAKLYRLVKAELAVRHEDVWQLIHDVEVLDEVMRQLPVTEPRRHLILRAPSTARSTRLTCMTCLVRRRLLASSWPTRSRRRRTPAHTTSRRPGTRISTAHGCGRCARPSARLLVRSPT